MDNMTAIVSAFGRAYHYRNAREPVFADPLAEKLLSEEEYAAISKHMSEGISYFAPGFQGTPEEALRLIVNRQLAPSVLARSAFCERAIDSAVRIGCRQIVLYASGYDTFALRTRDRRLRVFELDRPEMISDKRRRIALCGAEPACQVAYAGCDLSCATWKDALTGAGFDVSRPSFGSLLGISYYLSKNDFSRLIAAISSIACEGSSICFDYPQSVGGAECQRNRELAAATGEPMRAAYGYAELEVLLAEAGFLIYEHMNSVEATEALFGAYNRCQPGQPMAAPEGVGYCLAVRK